MLMCEPQREGEARQDRPARYWLRNCRTLFPGERRGDAGPRPMANYELPKTLRFHPFDETLDFFLPAQLPLSSLRLSCYSFGLCCLLLLLLYQRCTIISATYQHTALRRSDILYVPRTPWRSRLAITQ